MKIYRYVLMPWRFDERGELLWAHDHGLRFWREQVTVYPTSR